MRKLWQKATDKEGGAEEKRKKKKKEEGKKMRKTQQSKMSGGFSEKEEGQKTMRLGVGRGKIVAFTNSYNQTEMTKGTL